MPTPTALRPPREEPEPGTPASGRWIALALVVAAPMGLATVPTARFALDDWFQLAVARGSVGPAQGVAATAPFDLFRFSSGDPDANAEAMAQGLVPWFTDPAWKLSLWRPLASALHTLDLHLFGLDPTAAALHSLAWYVLLCGLVASLYQQLLPGRVGGIAGLLFAVAAPHHQAVAWGPARNALITAALGAAALVAHHRAHVAGWRAGRPLAWTLLALALLGGEAALGMAAMLLAHVAVHGGPGWRARVRSGAPYVAITLVWLGAYVAQGHGTARSGAYVNPLDHPIAFALEVPTRLAASMAVLLVGAPAELWFFAPASHLPLALLGLVATGLGAVWGGRVWRRQAPGTQHHLTWLALGALAALVPQLAGQLGPRSYVIPTLGSCAWIAVVLADARLPRSGGAAGRVAAGLLALPHVVLAPLVWVGASAFYARLLDDTEVRFAELGLDDPGSASRSLVVLTAPDALVGFYVPFRFAALHGATLPGWRAVSFAACDHRLHVTGERSLELELRGGRLFDTGFEQVLRDPTEAMPVGHAVRLPDLEVRVLATDVDGRPLRLGLTLARPLEDVELWAWTDGAMQRLAVPAIGTPLDLRWTARP
ncbi:MAG: hypothetical protein H6732_06090 [Alphaproteobacteria bacterium]|nr:hypothetical protein [Alphaproteobacteria bacterium]